MTFFKASILTLAYCLFVQNYATELVVLLSGASFFVGALSARTAASSTLTTFGAVTASFCWAVVLYTVGVVMGEYDWFSDSLQARTLLHIVDTCAFMSLGGALGFMLRFFSNRYAYGTIGEIVFSISATATLLFEHRNHSLDRPRFLADWALIHGFNPYDLILGAGIISLVLTMILAVRQRFARSVVLGVMVLLLAGGAAFYLRGQVDAKSPLDNLLSGASNQKSKGASDRLNNQEPPTPVAVALLHSEFESQDYILHFRQQALSFYDGKRFSLEPVVRFDADLIQNFPGQEPLKRADTSESGYRTRVDTSMFLLSNHPQPFALSNAIEVAPRKNPSPRRFVAAYDTVSSVLHVPIKRLLGRASIPKDWSAEKVAHYLAGPTDPRYRSLALELAEEVDLRHHGDAILSSLAVKRYLEKNGYYTLTEKHRGVKDPAASFLFGNLRGYCVHFAHSAVALLRSLGVASRVALGYAVDLRTRGDGSALVIMGNTAHAWPEIHIEGVGWMPFDIFPERSDEPPPELVQQSLESIFGELARDDDINSEITTQAQTKWRAELYALLRLITGGLLGSIVFLYLGLALRRIYLSRRQASIRQRFRYALDTLSGLGYRRHSWETRNEFALRLASICPSLVKLTHAFQAHTYGSLNADGRGGHTETFEKFMHELNAHIPFYQRLFGTLNLVAWLRTR
jgi:protein-glutamine gamma-glutamyltransferase